MQWGIQYLTGDTNTKGGGALNYYFGHFPENCMKLKTNCTDNGGMRLQLPHGSANVWHHE